jgi:hypothetical protein
MRQKAAGARRLPFQQEITGWSRTVDDYFAFSRFLLRRGRIRERQILSEAPIAAMTKDHLTPAQRVGGQVILGSDHGWDMACPSRSTAPQKAFQPAPMAGAAVWEPPGWLIRDPT